MLPVTLVLPIPTVNCAVFDVKPPLLALILVEPFVCVVAKPVLSIVATAVSLVDHDSVPNVAAVPSVKMPLAVNCSVFTRRMLAGDGVMVRVVNTGSVTVKVALFEVMPFAEAVMVVVP